MWKTGHFAETKPFYLSKNIVPSFFLGSLLLFLSLLMTACAVPLQSTNSSPSTNAANYAIKILTQAGRASVGVPYDAVTTVSGGSAPYSFKIVTGSLPPGTSLHPATGSITGTPSVPGTYNFVISVSSSGDSGAIKPSYVIASSKPSTPVQPSAMYGSTPVQIVVLGGSAASIAVSPSAATVNSLGQQQFTALFNGTAKTAAVWSASAGTISSAGVFVAPKVSNDTAVKISATSASDSSLHATAAITVVPDLPLAIAGSTLPEGNSSNPYAAVLSASGGVTPYKWSVASGTLPSGIQLQTSTGAISGMTAVAGSFPFTAIVTDSSGRSVSHAFTLKVASGSTSGFDGPAELPRVYIETATANTPATGTTTTVNAGGDFQSALNSANCGDTIQLQAGATFTGVFTLPAKSCDDSNWIVVRTSADDSALPAEGSRLTPCYAGVSALAGRPAFQCASTKNVLAKLVLNGSNAGPIVFASGANHYRLIGLEITRTPGTGMVSSLASVAAGGTANNLIFDRIWMHGTAQDDTSRGLWLEGGTNISIVDSFLTDFHCVSVCDDAQAIAGGIGSGPMGPYKITGNFLESSGENILFGGGTATSTPADIQISRNHMFKPLTWMKGQPGFVGAPSGAPFIIKNLLELKNAQRVLVDGNIMENSWGGFSQVGFAIVLTAKNQALSSGNVCPICQVTDVTIRYDSISHVGAGLQIANALAGTGAALDGQRYSIHDIVIDDIDGQKYNGPSELAQITVEAGAPLLQNLTINHVTAFPSTTLFVVGDMIATSTPMKNFAFINSLVTAGTYPIWSAGGGPSNCAYSDVPLATFNACFTDSVFATNAIINPPSGAAAGWPSPNFFPTSTTAVQFVNYQGGNGGDYHLQASSPYKGKGTDNKDLGADIDALNLAIAGVE